MGKKPVLIAACSCGVKLYDNYSGWRGVEIHSLRFVMRGKCNWIEVPDIRLTHKINACLKAELNLLELYK